MSDYADGEDSSGENKMCDAARSFIGEALADPRKMQLQLDMLDITLQNYAQELPGLVENALGPLFNAVSLSLPEKRNEVIIRLLDSGQFNPTKVFAIGMNNQFNDYSGYEIRQLPGYAALHEAAQAMNVAVDVAGLTRDEGVPPRLIINTFKTYNEGRMSSTYGDPDLLVQEEETPPAQDVAPPVEETPPAKSKPKRQHFKLK